MLPKLLRRVGLKLQWPHGQWHLGDLPELRRAVTIGQKENFAASQRLRFVGKLLALRWDTNVLGGEI
ncbi:hypothetical protein ScPMuIL_008792 [Solemya velum]